MFYQIDPSSIVSLDPASPINRITLDQETVTLHFSAHSQQVHQASAPAEYAAYQAFIEHSPRLVDYLETQRLRSIRERNTHPERDEMPRTLFAVFQSLPGSDGLELRLDASGAGEVWTTGYTPTRYLTWENFARGLDLLLQEQEHAA
jgi:hypothetical protein